MNCPTCGLAYNPGIPFCGNCGADLGAPAAVAPAPAPAPVSAPVPAVAAAPFAPAATAAPVATATVEPTVIQPAVAAVQPVQAATVVAPAAPQTVAGQPMLSTTGGVHAHTAKGVKGSSITAIIMGIINILIGFAYLAGNEKDKGSIFAISLGFGITVTILGILLLKEDRVPRSKLYVNILMAIIVGLIILSVVGGGTGGLLSIVLLIYLIIARGNLNKLPAN